MRRKLACFTPEVMLATFFFEAALAVYVVVRYRLTALTRIAVATLLSLAVFQWAEYAICTGFGSMRLWMIVGFVSITLLPPFGVHLVGILKRRSTTVWTCYAIAAGVIAWLLLPGGMGNAVCTGNYVIFDLHPILEPLYVLYYFGLLGTALYQAVNLAPRIRAARWFAVGYLSFILPMGIIFLINSAAYQAVPSIMCGFAALFAAILAFKVVPLSGSKKL
jgi:hypothetical protein